MNDAYTPGPSPAIPESPGAVIKAARVKIGMSIDALASRTRIARNTLEAMEKDAFDQMLEPVYARGYYRKCALVLGIADKPLVAAYDALYTAPDKPSLARLGLSGGGGRGASHAGAGISRLVYAALPILALLVFGIWIWGGTSPKTEPAPTVTVIDPLAPAVVNEPAPAPAPQAPGPATATPSADRAAAPERVVPPAATPAAPAPRAETTARSPADSAAASAQAGKRLVLLFNSISFARVEDASGRSLLSGVISAGERKTLVGQLPYSVVIGNAAAVSVEFAGKPVDILPFAKTNSAARFTLPATGK
ncbi:MAG: helix-turn-helix domain-containing protein [Panacagrimonas sp.]